jgi:hypothetical protein
MSTRKGFIIVKIHIFHFGEGTSEGEKQEECWPHCSLQNHHVARQFHPQ